MLPGDVVLLLDTDLAFFDRGAAFGIFRIRAPKMKRQMAYQRVLIELRHVRDVLMVLRDALCFSS